MDCIKKIATIDGAYAALVGSALLFSSTPALAANDLHPESPSAYAHCQQAAATLVTHSMDGEGWPTDQKVVACRAWTNGAAYGWEEYGSYRYHNLNFDEYHTQQVIGWIHVYSVECSSPEQIFNDTTHRCEEPGLELYKNLGPQQCTVPQQNCLKGNPINVAIGNKYQSETDFELTPLLSFRRFYNSIPQVGTNHLGPQWSHTYSRSIQYVEPGTDDATAVVSRPEGSRVVFRSMNGQWQADANVVGKLAQHNNIQGQLLGWTYTPVDAREVEEYDALGRLVQITRSNGNVAVLTYNNGAIENNANDYLLTKIQAENGRSLSFQYDASLRLTIIIDPAGAIYGYGYDTEGNLASVTYPGNVTRKYLYGEATDTGGGYLPRALTGITDGDTRIATFTYTDDGRAISTEHAGGVQKFTIQYNSDGSSVTATPLGASQQRTFTTQLGVKKPAMVMETCSNCEP